jgi:Holliday junction resolvase RusA-like endonuclease
MSSRESINLVIKGEPASKANSRRIVTIRGRPASIKSKKALAYVESFAYQCKTLKKLIVDDVSVTMTIYYASRRPDLDESVVLDCLQGRVYKNDRQVREKHIYWGLDRKNPRVEIAITCLPENL